MNFDPLPPRRNRKTSGLELECKDVTGVKCAPTLTQTTETADGCASEFYECIRISIALFHFAIIVPV